MSEISTKTYEAVLLNYIRRFRAALRDADVCSECGQESSYHEDGCGVKALLEDTTRPNILVKGEGWT